MVNLVACLSSGKGTWQEVKALIEKGDWEGIYIVTDDFGVKRFSSSKKLVFIIIDSRKPVKEIIADIKNQLKDKIIATEVALNMASGTGKEHMAVISALLKLGLGIRFVDFSETGIEEV